MSANLIVMEVLCRQSESHSPLAPYILHFPCINPLYLSAIKPCLNSRQDNKNHYRLIKISLVVLTVLSYATCDCMSSSNSVEARIPTPAVRFALLHRNSGGIAKCLSRDFHFCAALLSPPVSWRAAKCSENRKEGKKHYLWIANWQKSHSI